MVREKKIYISIRKSPRLIGEKCAYKWWYDFCQGWYNLDHLNRREIFITHSIVALFIKTVDLDILADYYSKLFPKNKTKKILQWLTDESFYWHNLYFSYSDITNCVSFWYRNFNVFY